MSCWVVPMVAAEMWGVPVDQILAKVKSGDLLSKSDNGFLFIDVAPESPQCNPPKSLRPERPPTYIAVTGAELAALAAIDNPIETTEGGEEHIPAPLQIEDWRSGRRMASRSRRGPVVSV